MHKQLRGIFFDYLPNYNQALLDYNVGIQGDLLSALPDKTKNNIAECDTKGLLKLITRQVLNCIRLYRQEK